MTAKKKACVIGHFGFGKNLLNGQTIKTKIITTELEKIFSANQILKIDTHGGIKVLPRIMVQMIYAFKKCENIIILPAHNGIRIFAPLCVAINKLFNKKLHYIVIGGWLPAFLEDKDRLSDKLKRFHGIYVETSVMKSELEKHNFANVHILKNFKDINIVSAAELSTEYYEPYRICTFSRVMKEKGIEDIVDAVISINEQYGKSVYTLDIYGPIDKEQIKWFENLKSKFPVYITYKGVVQFDKSVGVLKKYFLLIFPTKFFTEGIPGTILDAYAAGVPILAARWESFEDVIDEGVTGIGYTFDDTNSLAESLVNIMKNPQIITEKKKKCLEKANEYIPSKAISALLEYM